MDPEYRNWVQKVVWFHIHVIRPAMKRKQVSILYDDEGEPYLFSNITKKEIPREQVTRLMWMTRLKRRNECPS